MGTGVATGPSSKKRVVRRRSERWPTLWRGRIHQQGEGSRRMKRRSWQCALCFIHHDATLSGSLYSSNRRWELGRFTRSPPLDAALSCADFDRLSMSAWRSVYGWGGNAPFRGLTPVQRRSNGAVVQPSYGDDSSRTSSSTPTGRHKKKKTPTLFSFKVFGKKKKNKIFRYFYIYI